MADAYHPSAVESGWDAWWSDQGLYRPSSDFPSQPPLLLLLPPLHYRHPPP